MANALTYVYIHMNVGSYAEKQKNKEPQKLPHVVSPFTDETMKPQRRRVA